MADSAVAAALLTIYGPGNALLTIEMKINYLEPIVEGVVVAEAAVLRSSRRSAYAEVDVWAGGKLAARASTTYMIRSLSRAASRSSQTSMIAPGTPEQPRPPDSRAPAPIRARSSRHLRLAESDAPVLPCRIDADGAGGCKRFTQPVRLLRLVDRGHQQRSSTPQGLPVHLELVPRQAERQGFLERIPGQRSPAGTEQRASGDARRSPPRRRGGATRLASRRSDGAADDSADRGAHAGLLRLVGRQRLDLVARRFRRHQTKPGRGDRAEGLPGRAARVLNGIEYPHHGLHAHTKSCEKRAADYGSDDEPRTGIRAKGQVILLRRSTTYM